MTLRGQRLVGGQLDQQQQLPHLDLAHLLLPDLVVAVRDEILSHLS